VFEIIKFIEFYRNDRVLQKSIKTIKSVGCKSFNESQADISTRELYSNFNFNPNWMSNRSIWTENLEVKYRKLMNDSSRPPIHVFLQPHSHNDPGWKSTFEEYFNYSTKRILNTLVNKLPELSNMTFIWTEICFLSMWWEGAEEEQRETFKELLNSGRIEITTGGWVMTDEAIAHVYAQGS
jgi:alpha-mannosidase